jgi:hypothetical protein
MLIKAKPLCFINTVMLFSERMLGRGGSISLISNFIAEMFLHLRSLLLVLGMVTLVGVSIFSSKFMYLLYQFV